MHRSIRTLLGLVVVTAAIAACSSQESPLTPRISPAGTPPSMAKVQATDSLMMVTDISYSDTAVVLKRTTALPADISVTALIGTSGGSLRIDGAGLKVDIPGKALSVPTQITVRALKGDNVAYEFEPHGTVFSQPVKVVQDLSVTLAGSNPSMQAGMHAAYFDAPLDSSYTDSQKQNVKIKENQLSYKEGASQIRFYVGHFSGYLVSIGRW